MVMGILAPRLLTFIPRTRRYAKEQFQARLNGCPRATGLGRRTLGRPRPCDQVGEARILRG